ncbi:MAG: hypothetical protein ACREBO_01690 [Novosphingobium sp.]
MQRIWTKLFAALAVLMALSATPAAAQATRTWVSGVGDDANPCSRTAPCKTFAGAISKTAAGGEINCLDSAGFGGVTITKSITLSCVGVIGGVLVAGTNGIIVNAATTDRVVLNGLDIEGLGTGLNGIRILQARDVVVTNTYIRNFRGAPGNGISIAGATSVSLTMKDCVLSGNTVGVDVRNTAGTGKARIYNSLIVDSGFGVQATNANNTAEISGNEIVRGTALNAVTGGIINSYGDNILTGGTAPTIVPKG